MPTFARQLKHAYPRALAFLCLLTLVILRLPRWFADPFSLNQLVSWGLLIASLLLAVHGFLFLKKVGKPSGSIENTSVLVNSGAYRWIRHPLYTSLLLLTWGVFFKNPDLTGALLSLAVSVLIYVTAITEEAENISRFGLAYTRYMQHTRRFIPYII